MKVLFSTFECVPFVKVGGLADVAGSLPKVLHKKSCDVRVILPLHKKVDRNKFLLQNLNQRFPVPVGKNIEYANLWEGRINPKIPVYFIENEKYFARDEIYRTSAGDYPDNPERFIFFCRAVLEFCKSVGFKPDISDLFLMPSKSEPCGLGQLIALRYGSIPIVHKTGGLADTVIQFDSHTKKGCGFLFTEYNSSALLKTITLALETYKKTALWKTIVKNALNQDFPWDSSVEKYIEIYTKTKKFGKIN